MKSYQFLRRVTTTMVWNLVVGKNSFGGTIVVCVCVCGGGGGGGDPSAPPLPPPLCHSYFSSFLLFFFLPLLFILQGHPQRSDDGSPGRNLVFTHSDILVTIASRPRGQSAQPKCLILHLAHETARNRNRTTVKKNLASNL